MNYRLEGSLEHRSRLKGAAYLMGVDVALTSMRYRKILRGEAEIGISEVVDPGNVPYFTLSIARSQAQQARQVAKSKSSCSPSLRGSKAAYPCGGLHATL